MPARTATSTLPAASAGDTAATMADVVLPLLARGVIIRRPRVVNTIERLDLDRRAVRRVQQLHDTYGPGPVRIELPGRTFVIVLERRDAQRVLEGSPTPFAPATREKRAALRPFQPHGALASRGVERADRRRFNEAVLDSESPVHRLATQLQRPMVEEAQHIVEEARRQGQLTWDDFIVGWYRMVRRLVLGDAARDDHALTDMLAELRASGNWSVLGRRRRGLRERFLRQLQGHLDRAESGSLAELVAQMPRSEDTHPTEQVPQWLFAYDAAAWTCMRALALITSDAGVRARVGQELAGTDLSRPHDLAHLRACVLDTLRLFPTTPAVLRDTTKDTSWDTGTLATGAGVLVFAPFFHRDDRVEAHADEFAPHVWLDDDGDVSDLGRIDDDWPFIPFSAGPAVCPGRHLVLLTVSTVLGTLLGELDPAPIPGPLDTARLPSALSPFSLRFAAGARSGAPSGGAQEDDDDE